jgi:hypothetical protein
MEEEEEEEDVQIVTPQNLRRGLFFNTERMFLQKDCCLLDCVPNFSVLFNPKNGESGGGKKRKKRS